MAIPTGYGNQLVRDRMRRPVVVSKSAQPADPWVGLPKGSVIYCEVDLDRLQLPPWQTQYDPKILKLITEDFRPERCEALVINARVNGVLSLMDGKHRDRGLAAQDPPIRRWMCRVHVGLSLEEEAELFAALNRDKRKIGKEEIFWAGIECGDPQMVELKRMVESTGFAVAPLGNGSNNRGIRAVGTLMHAQHKRYSCLVPALATIAKVYGTDEAPDSSEIRAVTSFYARYRGRFDESKLRTAMASLSRTTWRRTAVDYRRERHCSSEEAYGQMLVRAYNAYVRLKRARIPDWLDATHVSDDEAASSTPTD